MKFVTVVLLALAIVAVPAMAQEGDPETPPKDPPKVEPPPDAPPDTPADPSTEDPVVKPTSEEEIRLKLVEGKAKELADTLKKRMDAAKTDTERGSAITDCAGGTDVVSHPILAQALIPYLNPRQIRAGLIYGDGVIGAALDALKKQPFDETFYGVMKMIDANRNNLPYVQKLLPVFGEIKCKKAVAPLVEMAKDKRDGHIELCRVAVQTLGVIGHRDAIDPLIRELEEEDKAGANDVKAKARRASLNTCVLDALKNIVGQEFKLGSQWRQWWNKNLDTFQREKKITPPDPGGDGK